MVASFYFNGNGESIPKTRIQFSIVIRKHNSGFELVGAVEKLIGFQSFNCLLTRYGKQPFFFVCATAAQVYCLLFTSETVNLLFA